MAFFYIYWLLVPLQIEENKAVLKMVHGGETFRKLREVVLAEAPFDVPQGKILKAWVQVEGDKIEAGFEGGPVVEAADPTFRKGKIAILATVPARFYEMEVYMTSKNRKQFELEKQQYTLEEKQLQAENPQLVLWKKINTKGFGCGRNLRFGDLNNDGQIDVLVGQIVNHGPVDQNSEISCLTAMTFDGQILWQKGTPDRWKVTQTSDVAIQIHDINNDGKTEVIYTQNYEIIIADGATGEIIKKQPTPVSPETKERIMGDCLFFCDLSGVGYDSDIIIKDRYWNIWAYNSDLKLLWTAACNTGHYPYAKDIDGDGRDELMVGYTLFSHDGKVLWSKDEVMKDHADGMAIVDFKNDRSEEHT